ncbi:PREDICTED: putative F-box protein At3g20030 [Brassica oleracea var. oleracea]|uniref:putative F-box protein At3g20030 n=1 Tax=Brassica oleracea var. oleracea TaxID=109376 RepID=UPI0006A6D5ED|nr:PREDICTED: putative F-box protein At3g20030 [Brassica oleracea var. oleracea]
MTMITDLSLDLVEEILSKVSLTSLKAVKSTCKGWNTLSKDESFTKKHSAIEFPVQRLFVWNPYLAQTRWIELRINRTITDQCAIGYDSNKNHKLLWLFYEYDNNDNVKHEIYDFKSSSWRVLDIITPRKFKRIWKRGVSLKGNSYFVVDGKILGFDFTREKFGPFLDLPFETHNKIPYSCVRGEQLAVLFQRHLYELVIWITTEIKPDAVSWSSFCKVDMKPFLGDHGFKVGSFVIDKEKKVAVVCGDCEERRDHIYKGQCYVVGEDGCYQEKTDMEDIVISYVPSLVQLQ